MLQKSRPVLCLITTVYNLKERLKTCFNVDIRIGMVGDVLVGLLPERLNAYRYNDLKTDLQGLL